MKKRIAITLSILLLTIAGAAFALARHRTGYDLSMAFMQEEGKHGPGGFMAQHIMERVAAELGLSEEQKTQIKGILTAERPTVEPLFQQLKQHHQALREATANGQFNEEQVRAIAAQQGQTITELIVAKERVKSKIYAILTPEQRVKAAQMIEHFESHMHEHFAK